MEIEPRYPPHALEIPDHGTAYRNPVTPCGGCAYYRPGAETWCVHSTAGTDKSCDCCPHRHEAIATDRLLCGWCTGECSHKDDKKKLSSTITKMLYESLKICQSEGSDATRYLSKAIDLFDSYLFNCETTDDTER